MLQGVIDQLIKELSQLKQQFEHIFDNIEVAIWSVELTSNHLTLSTGYMKLFGYSQEDFIRNPKLWREIIYLEDIDLVDVQMELLYSGQSVTFEHRLILQNREIRWVHCIGTPVRDSLDQVVRINGVVFDINTRVMMEEAIHQSEQRYKSLFEYNSDLICDVDLSGNVVSINQETENVIGHPVHHLWVELFDTQGVQRLTEYFEKARQGLPQNYEMPSLHKNGKVFYWEIKQLPIFIKNEIVGIFVICKDITLQITTEKALAASESMYRLIAENTTDMVRMIDVKGTTIYASPSHQRIVGYTPEQYIKQEIFMKIVHPDDWEVVNGRFCRMIESKQAQNTQFRISHANGQLIYLEEYATPVLGINNEVESIVIVSRDITEKKRVEQTLEESEKLYYLLQTSLDRFSHDLFGDIKVNEVELRLIKEVQEVTKTEKVSIIEVDRNNHVVVTNGYVSISSKHLQDITEINPKDLPLCEIIEMPDVYLVKIAEVRGKGYLLCIDKQNSNLNIIANNVWLKTITRYVNVLYDNFRIIEELTKELEQLATHQLAPSWLLRLLFSLSENERKRLSQDLHDAALQEQIIWYRILEQISTDRSIPEHFREQLQQVMQGLLDVIYQIRNTCNELRPPLLKEAGIVSSLQALIDLTQIRTNFSIHFESADFHHTLTDDLLIGVYRILQELLANAGKHSNATRVYVELTSQPHKISLKYEDNGIGMDLSRMEDSFSSMGVYGMKERVRSMNGKIDFQSTPNNGLAAFISIPVH